MTLPLLLAMLALQAAPAVTATDGGTRWEAVAGAYALSICDGCDPGVSEKSTPVGELILSSQAVAPPIAEAAYFEGTLSGPHTGDLAGPIRWTITPRGEVMVGLHVDRPRTPDAGKSFVFEIEGENLRGHVLVNSVRGHRQTSNAFALRRQPHSR